MPAAIDPGSWEPTTTQQMLRQRAQLLAYLRDFFHQREVLEVETPLLGAHTVTELNIDSMAVRERWLQTSPEYCTKRLLAAGSGPIYEIARVFQMANMALAIIPNLPCWNGIARASTTMR